MSGLCKVSELKLECRQLEKYIKNKKILPKIGVILASNIFVVICKKYLEGQKKLNPK